MTFLSQAIAGDCHGIVSLIFILRKAAHIVGLPIYS
jgi:hypothetical protein